MHPILLGYLRFSKFTIETIGIGQDQSKKQTFGASNVQQMVIKCVDHVAPEQHEPRDHM